MKPKTALIASLTGTVLVTLCCFTPILVVLLGIIGLSAIVGYLDYVLLPALGILVALTVLSYFRYRRSVNRSKKNMSEDCCSQTKNSLKVNCPVNGVKGKRVQTITLKSLLKPRALENLNAQSNYFFCNSIDCPVVYFNEQGQTFIVEEVKIPVFQKSQGEQVPVCYCFDWTRDRILQEVQQTKHSTAEDSIRTHIQAGRCGCEVNNPQGSCCLANVRKEVRNK